MNYRSGLSCSGGHFDLDAKKTELAELEKQSNSSSLWNDPDNARKLTQRISRLSEPINKYNKVFQDLGDLAELEEMLEEESGTDYEELQAEAMRFNKELNDWEFLQMLSGPDDRRNCILTIHPGAGGTESADWAGMLMRMYLRYVERRGFQSEVIDLQPADQAGVKSVSIEVVGDFAFGRLKSEIGVHRLVRISPFDASNRRHTSFASVYVYPELEEASEIEIVSSEIRVDTFRASGAGGQHVNKTDSAIRITHLPTNIVVSCQSERSQHRNRETAMRFLAARLLKLQREEEAKKRDVLEAQKSENAWGSQIRSYVLHPYHLVKDVRTNVETSNTDAVLDGDIDSFVEGYLMENPGS